MYWAFSLFVINYHLLIQLVYGVHLTLIKYIEYILYINIFDKAINYLDFFK